MKRRTMLPETVALAAVCIVDLGISWALFIMGWAEEANPVCRFLWELSPLHFALVKILPFTLVPLALLEWARTKHPEFVQRGLRFCLWAYVTLLLTVGSASLAMAFRPEISRAWGEALRALHLTH